MKNRMFFPVNTRFTSKNAPVRTQSVSGLRRHTLLQTGKYSSRQKEANRAAMTFPVSPLFIAIFPARKLRAVSIKTKGENP